MSEILKAKETKDILDELDGKISDYLSLKDNIIDEDYLEVFSDSLSIVKAITSTYKMISKKRLAYFLKGLSLEKDPTFEQLCKLSDYIDSEEKAEFISESITKVLTSNSKKAAFLLGIIIYRLINSKVNLSYRELICANALSTFYDFDIDNIIIFSKYVEHINKKRKKLNRDWFDVYHGFRAWCKETGIVLDRSHLLTIEKCVASQIIIKEIEVELDIDGDDPGSASATNAESYKFTEAGDLLLSNLKHLEEL